MLKLPTDSYYTNQRLGPGPHHFVKSSHGKATAISLQELEPGSAEEMSLSVQHPVIETPGVLVIEEQVEVLESFGLDTRIVNEGIQKRSSQLRPGTDRTLNLPAKRTPYYRPALEPIWSRRRSPSARTRHACADRRP